MSKNGSTFSIFFRIDEGIVEHNTREFISKNVDNERVSNNTTYCRQALAEYNAQQKQSSRRTPNYFEHNKKSAKGNPYYEIFVQFDDMDTCG